MKKYLSIKTWIGISILLGLLFSACSQSHETSSTMDGELRIVATTTFIGDVVGVITGDAAAVITLLEPGQNPHSYQPRPMDMVNISEADVIFVIGLGLEEFLDDLLDGSDTDAEVIVVSEGITPLKIGENLGVSQDDDHQIHSGEDPHVWFDPNNIMIWTENISRVLGRIDSPNAESYQANAETYRNELLELDTWIREQIELIPPENRELVTDHT
ncbi:MAG: metal ABC transporter substrate-binding protein, partial [Anaerolineales bacterium]|nr:metal ABC transporter substrate-binding protein [Anaerolineales bacterium]